MQTNTLVIIAFALLVPRLGGAQTSAEDALDSTALLTDLGRQIGAMVDRGDPVSLEAIRAQMEDLMGYPLHLTEPDHTLLPPEELYRLCRPSVVVVGKVYKCDKCSKWHTGVASGFVLSADGVVVTNYHVAAGDDKTRGFAVRTWDGRVHPVESVLASSKSSDLLVLRVKATDLIPLPVARTAAVGSTVYSIGHSGQHFYAMTRGIVSGYFRRGRARHMAITADFAKGASGAPVLDSTGAVVGIVRSTSTVLTPKTDKHEANVQMVWKYCIPSSDLLDLVR